MFQFTFPKVETLAYFSLTVSILSFLWSMCSFFILRKSNIDNVLLNNTLTDLNKKKHWRNEKIYILSEELQSLSHQYWLSDANYEKDQIVQLNIKSKFQDIEDHTIALRIDITSELTLLREHITGGLFESPDRKKIEATHQKFLHIQQAVSSIKSKLP